MSRQISLLPRRALRWALRKAGGGAAAAARRARRAEAALATPELLQAEQRRRVGTAMRVHDMVEDPDEAYYRERYLEWIDAELSERGTDLSGSFLDAGCGSGRLAVPLAERLARHGGSVIGVDFLGSSVDRARREVAAAGLANLELYEAHLLEFLRDRAEGAFAGGLFIEVAFALPDLDAVVAELGRVLRPGAPLLASFRSLHYMALSTVARRDLDTAEVILSRRSGMLPGIGWHNWHTSGDARGLLEHHGFAHVRISAVGLASGIEGDPLATIARPSGLGEQELAGLGRVESGLAQLYPDASRYLLASAVRL